jgi:hypothetical protein
MLLIVTPAFADDKYPSDQTEKENPYVMQPSPDPAPSAWIPRLRTGDESFYLEIHGWINKALLIHNDGASTLSYFPVDNDAGGTRIGIRLRGRMDKTLRIGVNGEVEWEPCSTTFIDQTDTSCSADVNTDTVGWRKGELLLDHLEYGRLSLGQGPSAADNASQLDLSGTISAGYSAAATMSGGQFILFEDGTFSELRWRDVIPNFDGFCCVARVRYDSPRYYGFSLAGSVGTDIYPESTDIVVTDIALRYRKIHNGLKVAGAVAYSEPDTSSNYIVNGSFSTLHDPTGLSLTVAGAVAEVDSRDVNYVYVKPGYQRSFFKAGKSAFSADTYYGTDIGIKGSTSTALGLQAVQYFDYWKAEIYLGLRWLSYDDNAGDYNSAQALIAGTRVRF